MSLLVPLHLGTTHACDCAISVRDYSCQLSFPFTWGLLVSVLLPLHTLTRHVSTRSTSLVTPVVSPRAT